MVDAPEEPLEELDAPAEAELDELSDEAAVDALDVEPRLSVR